MIKTFVTAMGKIATYPSSSSSSSSSSGGGGDGDGDGDGGGGGDGDGDFPTTLPAWQGKRGITGRDQISRSGNPSL